MSYGMSSAQMGQAMRGPAGVAQGQNQAGNFKEKIPSGYKKYSLNNYDDQQTDLYNRGFQHVAPDSYLSKLSRGDQDIFSDIEAPAWQDFNRTQGENASRFSGFGMGARKGSGFKNYQNQASSDFAMQLQSNRQNLMQQALRDLHGMSNDLLQRRPQEQGLVAKDRSSSGWGGPIGAVGGGLAGFALGGGAGALTGANLGYQALSGF